MPLYPSLQSWEQENNWNVRQLTKLWSLNEFSLPVPKEYIEESVESMDTVVRV